MSNISDYGPDIEKLFVRFFVTDPNLFIRCLGIINPDHFEHVGYKKVIHVLCEHTKDYNDIPTLDQIHAQTGILPEVMTVCRDSDKEWFLDEYEQFARHKEISNAVYSAPDFLEQQRYGEVEDMIKNAVAVGIVKDLGLDYFEDPKARLEEILNSRGAISTGWDAMDEKLYGGVNRGEISIFAGQSGAGKSVFLQNLAINWVNQGMNVIYISLELSESLCASRIDAMVTDYGTREVLKNRDDVHLRVKTYQKNNKGNLRIKQMKNGSTANDIKAYVKEYEIQTGEKVDALVLDYLDLFMPTNVKISPENLFVKDKYVTENLRDLAVELDVLMATASQLNRSSHEETIEFSHANIAGGLSKINTADNVFGIFQTKSMKEGGRYQLQFMKTRSSSGVGSSIDLKFNPKTLRITDLEADDIPAIQTNTQGILDKMSKDPCVNTGSDGTTKTIETIETIETTIVSEPKEDKSVVEEFSALQAIINKIDQS